jgi:hypothetical protein
MERQKLEGAGKVELEEAEGRNWKRIESWELKGRKELVYISESIGDEP